MVKNTKLESCVPTHTSNLLTKSAHLRGIKLMQVASLLLSTTWKLHCRNTSKPVPRWHVGSFWTTKSDGSWGTRYIDSILMHSVACTQSVLSSISKSGPSLRIWAPRSQCHQDSSSQRELQGVGVRCSQTCSLSKLQVWRRACRSAVSVWIHRAAPYSDRSWVAFSICKRIHTWGRAIPDRHTNHLLHWNILQAGQGHIPRITSLQTSLSCRNDWSASGCVAGAIVVWFGLNTNCSCIPRCIARPGSSTQDKARQVSLTELHTLGQGPPSQNLEAGLRITNSRSFLFSFWGRSFKIFQHNLESPSIRWNL